MGRSHRGKNFGSEISQAIGKKILFLWFMVDSIELVLSYLPPSNREIASRGHDTVLESHCLLKACSKNLDFGATLEYTTGPESPDA